MIFPAGAHQLTLFDSSSGKDLLLLPQPSGDLSFGPLKKQIDKPVISQVFGLLIFLVSTSLLGLIILPIVISEASYRLSQVKKETVRVVKNEPSKPKTIQFADLLGKVEFEPVPVPVDADFGIVIPKIGVNARVIPNVDPNTPKVFMAALKLGVAHAAGSSLPDEDGITFIFGHSTDYVWNVARFNAIFYQIKDLEIGDEVNLFYHGQRYFYKVTEKKLVQPKDTSFLAEPTNGRVLILQTCYPPGTIKERLLIFARPISVLGQAN